MYRSTRAVLTVSGVLLVLIAATRPCRAAVGSQVHPALQRGVPDESLQDRTRWDTVNTLNGNVNVSIPIGIEYPLSESFHYQLALNYNSNVWDMNQVSPTVSSASPTQVSNSGFGWDLSLGRLIAPAATGNTIGKWIYVSPDGRFHPFYSSLHWDVPKPADNVFFTRDATYLRLTQVASNLVSVELPNGRVVWFQPSGASWLLTRITDRFNNFIGVDYGTPNAWVVTDSQGRRQTIYFRSDPAGYYPAVVDRVVLAAFGGTTATYTFAYTTAAVTLPSIDNDPSTAATVNLPLLQSVTYPDGAKHAFTYKPFANDLSGRLESMTLPTLGVVSWKYQPYSFVTAGRATTLPLIDRGNLGIASRTMTDASGGVQGTWTYTPALLPSSTDDQEFSLTVTSPLGHKTVFYSSVNSTTSSGLWNKSDFGLPITKNVADKPTTVVTNVAAAAAGATATADSTVNSGYAASGAIDGDRKGTNWGNGGGWNDGTTNWWPDTLTVTFNGMKTIDTIDVFTLEDNYTSPVEPTSSMTFSQYGIQDFDVQYLSGSTWTTIPGGSVLSNNLVWRHFTFTPVTASAVRVVVKRALNMSSRITEVQAFQTAVAPDARFLSKRYFDCDSTGANCTLVRSIYQRFEQDGDTDPATSDGGQSNRRLASDSTQYNDDLVNGAPRFAAVNRSDFDGLGHYREVDTDGNFGSGDVKQTSTIFNPGSGTYPGSFTLPPANAVWFLHAAVRTRMVEGNTATVDEFCYDSTGFMSRTRRWASGNALGAQGATDVVTAMTNDGSGQAGTIRYFGGGFQPIATGDLCSLSLPSSDSYRIVQTFVGGVFQRSVFVDSSGSAVAPPSVDRDIDSGTGLVKVERDTTGLASTYSYDALGRRLSTQQDGALKITVSYVRATGPGGAGLTKAQVATAPDGAVLWQTGITYDSFGLKWREQRSTLTSGMASKYSLYSALDQLQSWSEFSTGSPKYTTVLSWDPFNRPKRIRPPEGAAHDVTYGYAGEFSVTRTAAMGTWYDGTTGQVLEYPRSKTDTYDRQHRRWRASVQGRIPSTTPDSAFVRQYDVGNRLATVSINGRVVASNSYDGNGNLTVSTDEWSQRSQSSFDALGLPHQRTSAGGVLSLDYDRAGRLIAVRNGSAILKDYQYSTSSTGNDRSLGRVTRARRFGQQPGGSPWTVSRTYTYAGTAGQISQVVTALFDGVHDEEFKQSYSYDAQGNVIDVGYPLEASLDAGSLGRDRHVVTSFSQRLPTSVQDVVSQRSTQPWITAAAYWPNSLPSSITAGNGVRTDISPDPFDVPRPAGVATSGVVTLYGQPDQNWSSGAFQYDGLGALVRVGSTYYLDAAGSSMEPDPGAPAPPAECDWTDEFGLDIAGLPDPSACQPLAFYYYDADDKLICIENRMADTRKWTFEGLDGRVLTEYVRKNTTRTWLRTDDSVYFRGDLIGSEHRGPGEPTTRKYIQQGFGASGIATDANGARAQ